MIDMNRNWPPRTILCNWFPIFHLTIIIIAFYFLFLFLFFLYNDVRSFGFITCKLNVRETIDYCQYIIPLTFELNGNLLKITKNNNK